MATYHISTYMVRGSKYAFTSACAIFAGYLMQTTAFDVFDLPYLLIPIIASVYFFMCYASRFHSLESRDDTKDATNTLLESEAIRFFPGVATLIIIIVILIRFAFNRSISPTLIFALGVYALMYFFYGRFLLRHPSPNDIPIVRHRLVWPVILSIGLSLYYGLTFSILAHSLTPLLPLSLILLLYVVSETAKLGMRRFLKLSFVASLLATTFAVLTQLGIIPLPTGLRDFFSLMLFCITASGYLAVFESWKVSSDIAKLKRGTAGATAPHTVVGLSKASQYSIATLTGLTLSVWLMPLFFVFSGYGTFFLLGFIIHAFIAFVIWYLGGRGEKLITLPWGGLKIGAGLLFLLLLVLATFFNSQPNYHLLRWIVSGSGMGILALPVFWSGVRLYNYFRREYRKGRQNLLLRVFARRVNFIRVLSLFCWIACFVLLSYLPESFTVNASQYYKAELAFITYSVCILICLVVEILDSIGITPTLATISCYLIGLLFLSRVVPSCLIGMAVFLPSIYKGNGLREALASSVPFILSAIGGFALNDYFDAKKDRINKPYRAIPSGMLTPAFVLRLSLICLSTALFFSLYIAKNNTERILYLLTIAGVASYNLFVKQLSLSKTFLTSGVSCLPLLFSVVSLNYPKAFLLLPLATACFILGREWLMDIRDVKGDQLGGTVTIPMVIGSGRAATLGFIFQLLSVAVLVPIAVSTGSFLSYSLTLSILLAVAVLFPLWYYKAGHYRHKIIQYLWLPMLFGVMMLLS